MEEGACRKIEELLIPITAGIIKNGDTSILIFYGNKETRN